MSPRDGYLADLEGRITALLDDARVARDHECQEIARQLVAEMDRLLDLWGKACQS